MNPNIAPTPFSVVALLAVVLAQSLVSAEPDASIPSPTEVRRAVIKLLQAESAAKSVEDKHAALVTLCDAYVAIRLHSKYEGSEILQGEAVRIRRRLITEGERLTDRLTRDKRDRPAFPLAEVDSAVTVAAEQAASERASDMKALAAGGGGAIADEGWALVELIQRTVHPDFWETTGGPGSIRYFAMKRVLVVRATTQVHEDLVALLRQL